MNDHNHISCEWAEGTEETTVWIWSDTPRPTTVRFDRDEWDQLKERAEEHVDGDIEKLFTRLIRGALEDENRMIEAVQPEETERR